jgi:hypothetical protein
MLRADFFSSTTKQLIRYFGFCGAPTLAAVPDKIQFCFYHTVTSARTKLKRLRLVKLSKKNISVGRRITFDPASVNSTDLITGPNYHRCPVTLANCCGGCSQNVKSSESKPHVFVNFLVTHPGQMMVFVDQIESACSTILRRFLCQQIKSQRSKLSVTVKIVISSCSYSSGVKNVNVFAVLVRCQVGAVCFGCLGNLRK